MWPRRGAGDRGRRAPKPWILAPLSLFLAVWLLASGVLAMSHRAPRLQLPRAAAVHAALRADGIVRALRGTHWDSVTATAVDGRLERVTFLAHGRALAEAAVEPDGAVTQVVDFHHLPVPYGNWIAYQPALLVGLAAVFVLMAGVSPWRRLRNLDVVVALWLLVPVVLLQARFLSASTLAAVPALGYLMGRCAWTALGPASRSSPGTPLALALAPGLAPRHRIRLLRLLAIGLGLVLLMVAVSSNGAVDVIYAVMEGATKVVHGVLPYGHMPGDVVHGDTYPLLSYLVYVPLAWASPVTSTWDSVDPALALAAVFAAVAAWAIFRGTGGPRPRSPGAQESSLCAAVAWLAFPPVLITVSTGTTDVGLAAMLAVVLLLWRRPGASTALLAAAAWFKLAPAALLPVWLAPLRGRRLAAALGAIVAVSAAMVGVLLALGGWPGAVAMTHALAFQFSRDSPMSIWTSPVAHGLQPLVQAAVLGLIATAAVMLWRRPALAGERPRMAALAAAILIGLQLSADYWTFLYIAWVLPLLSLSLLSGAVVGPEPAIETTPAAAPRSTAAAPA